MLFPTTRVACTTVGMWSGLCCGEAADSKQEGRHALQANMSGVQFGFAPVSPSGFAKPVSADEFVLGGHEESVDPI